MKSFGSWLYKKDIGLYRLYKIIKNTGGDYIYVFIICLISLPLLLAAYFQTNINFSLIFSLANILFFVLYHAIYLFKFKKLTSIDFKSNFYKIYEFWPLVFINAFFLFGFCMFFSFLNQKHQFLIDKNQINYYSILLLSLQKIIDGLLLGSLNAAGIKFTSIEIHSWWGKLIAQSYKIIVDLAIISNISKEVLKKRKIKQALQNIRKYGKESTGIFYHLDHSKTKAILKHLNKKYDNSPFQFSLLEILSKHNSRKIKDLFLRVMQETTDKKTIRLCKDYFNKYKDRRFRLVLQHLKK